MMKKVTSQLWNLKKELPGSKYKFACGTLPETDRSILSLWRRHCGWTRIIPMIIILKLATYMPKLTCNTPKVVSHILKLFSFQSPKRKKLLLKKQLNQVNVMWSCRCCLAQSTLKGIHQMTRNRLSFKKFTQITSYTNTCT